MKESVCPFCSKDLAGAAHTLSAPIAEVMKLHLSVHLHEKWRTLYDFVESLIASATLEGNIASIPRDDYLALNFAFFDIKKARQMEFVW